MKRNGLILLISALATAFITSCSTAHKVQGVNLNGKWLLNSVNVEGSDTGAKFRATLFNDVSSDCLTGSIWNLYNNGSGSYTVSTGLPACLQGERQIYWSVRNDNGVNYFQFKKLDDKTKPKDVKEGYRLGIHSIADSAMVLTSPVEVESQTVNVVYNFTRQ